MLTAVTGVAGSGKSSLIHGHLLQVEPEAKLIDQRLSSGNRRSNPATYTGMLDAIRKAFAKPTRSPPRSSAPTPTAPARTARGSASSTPTSSTSTP